MSRLLSPSAIRTHASHHVSALMVLMMWLKSVRNLSRSLGVTSPRVARLCFRPSCAEYASHNCCKTWSVIWWFLPRQYGRRRVGLRSSRRPSRWGRWLRRVCRWRSGCGGCARVPRRVRLTTSRTRRLRPATVTSGPMRPSLRRSRVCSWRSLVGSFLGELGCEFEGVIELALLDVVAVRLLGAYVGGDLFPERGLNVGQGGGQGAFGVLFHCPLELVVAGAQERMSSEVDVRGPVFSGFEFRECFRCGFDGFFGDVHLMASFCAWLIAAAQVGCSPWRERE